MSTEASLRNFFQSSHYAVVGASTDPAKFGHKVFAWYLAHDLPATPVNPKSPTIPVAGENYPAIPSLSALKDPAHTSVSIITPPSVTLKALSEAKALGVPSVWLQPGTFDDEVLKFAYANFGAVLAGDGGRGSEGWCVLVDGDRGLRAAGKL